MILHRHLEISTGASQAETTKAEACLAKYIQNPKRYYKLRRAPVEQRLPRGLKSVAGVGHLYVIGAADDKNYPVKIGFTALEPKTRLANIQGNNPKNLTYLRIERCRPEVEREMHRRFSTDRIRGEWFHRSDAIEQLIIHGLPEAFGVKMEPTKSTRVLPDAMGPRLLLRPVRIVSGPDRI